MQVLSLALIVSAVGCAGPSVIRVHDAPPTLSPQELSVRLGGAVSGCLMRTRVEGRDGFGHGGLNYRDGNRAAAERALRSAAVQVGANVVVVTKEEKPYDVWIGMPPALVHFPYATLTGTAYACVQ